jgi:hypothetical protein
LRDVSFAFAEENPAVQTFTQVEVGSEFIGLVVVNCESFLSKFFLGFLLVFDSGFVEGRVGDSFGENGLIKVEFFLDIFVFIGLS